jgi:hypothetical protein
MSLCNADIRSSPEPPMTALLKSTEHMAYAGFWVLRATRPASVEAKSIVRSVLAREVRMTSSFCSQELAPNLEQQSLVSISSTHHGNRVHGTPKLEVGELCPLRRGGGIDNRAAREGEDGGIETFIQGVWKIDGDLDRLSILRERAFKALQVRRGHVLAMVELRNARGRIKVDVRAVDMSGCKQTFQTES